MRAAILGSFSHRSVTPIAFQPTYTTSCDETRAPYLVQRTVKPQPSHRRNEPMYLAHIVEELARDRGEDIAATAAATTATARDFFRLPMTA